MVRVALLFSALVVAAVGVQPPPNGAVFCGGIPGSLKGNLTVISEAFLGVLLEINTAGVQVDCPKEAFLFDSSSGLLDISADIVDPNDCLAKAAQRDGGSQFTFTFDGVNTVTIQDSKWGALDLHQSGTGKC
eukprot:Hpha_TRINITY_DN15284_c0_g1::TRINITY_DN15284_c0_g1_i1::g.67069::m.67069